MSDEGGKKKEGAPASAKDNADPTPSGREMIPTPTPPPALASDAPMFGHPLSSQSPIGTAVNFSIGGSPELAALQRLPPDALSQVFQNAHRLEDKRLDHQDKQLERLAKALGEDKSRAHDLEITRRTRVMVIVAGLLVALGGLVAFLLSKEMYKEALGVIALAFTHVVTLVGGIGYEKWRKSEAEKRDSAE